MPDFPAWYYGPAGEAVIFSRVEDVPPGWRDAPFAHHPLDHDGDGRKGGSRARSIHRRKYG